MDINNKAEWVLCELPQIVQTVKKQTTMVEN